MNIETIYTISSIVGIIAALIAPLAPLAFGIQWWSGNVIAKKQEDKILVMEKDARIKKPTIFSQKAISLNVPDGDLFVQKYVVSINSPVVNIPLYTVIRSNPVKGIVERVGDMQLNDVGGGLRQTEGADVSYVDVEYTVRTNRALDDGETIIFTLEKDSSLPYKYENK